jgi:hypothetical protein
MSGKMVLSRAETAGVRITRNGDRLSVACRGELPPDIRDGLRQHKAEILDLIAEPWWGMGFPAFRGEPFPRNDLRFRAIVLPLRTVGRRRPAGRNSGGHLPGASQLRG